MKNEETKESSPELIKQMEQEEFEKVVRPLIKWMRSLSVKSESVAFAEWILAGSWKKYSDTRWVQRIPLNITGTTYQESIKTTSELFKIFTKQNKG